MFRDPREPPPRVCAAYHRRSVRRLRSPRKAGKHGCRGRVRPHRRREREQLRRSRSVIGIA